MSTRVVGSKRIAYYSAIFGVIVFLTSLISKGMILDTIIAGVFTVLSYISKYKPFNFLQYFLPLLLGGILIVEYWEGSWGYIFVYVFGFAVMDMYNILDKKIYIGTVVSIAIVSIALSIIDHNTILEVVRLISVNIFMILIIDLRYKTKEKEIKEKETKKLKDIIQIQNLESSVKDKHIKELLEIVKKDSHAWETVLDFIQQDHNKQYIRGKK